MDASMRKPNFGKPRSAVRAVSLSGHLPRLKAPLSAARTSVARPHPVVGRPGQAAAQSPEGGRVAADGCRRCGPGHDDHPVRYVCDNYPHPIRPRRASQPMYALRVAACLVVTGVLILTRVRYPQYFSGGATAAVVLAVLVGLFGAFWFARRLVRRI